MITEHRRRRPQSAARILGPATEHQRTGYGEARQRILSPLRALGVEITPELIAEKQWDAFWDAPLDVPGMDGRGRTNVGMPRTPGEIQRATAVWEVTGCTVATKGARLEVGFPGVRLGLFTGRLQITVCRGTNLIRAEVVARTNAPSVAYKYEAGLSGLSIDPAARVVWRDLSNQWQDYQLGGAVNDDPVPLKVANRIVIAETFGGTISAFPPPHTFFFAREVETDLGYGWYRKDAASFPFGVRQAEGEEDPRYKANFALYSARPGTWQQDGGLLPCRDRRRCRGAQRRIGVHPRRPFQGVAGVSGDGQPLPHGSRTAPAGVGQSRHQAAGPGGVEGGRDHHCQSHRPPER